MSNNNQWPEVKLPRGYEPFRSTPDNIGSDGYFHSKGTLADVHKEAALNDKLRPMTDALEHRWVPEGKKRTVKYMEPLHYEGYTIEYIGELYRASCYRLSKDNDRLYEGYWGDVIHHLYNLLTYGKLYY